MEQSLLNFLWHIYLLCINWVIKHKQKKIRKCDTWYIVWNTGTLLVSYSSLSLYWTTRCSNPNICRFSGLIIDLLSLMAGFLNSWGISWILLLNNFICLHFLIFPGQPRTCCFKLLQPFTLNIDMDDEFGRIYNLQFVLVEFWAILTLFMLKSY